VKLALQLLGGAQAEQHLLGEAVGEAEADLLQHSPLQPARAQAQETVCHVVLVEVLKSSGQLQARKDHDGLQVPLKPPQHFHSRGSANQATLDLLVDVPGKLLTYVGSGEEGLLEQGA